MRRIMKTNLKINHCTESGQVLVTGLFILIILLLLVFAGFDIHNALRARFKVQTAQEAAALTGATWQKHSLNLIGEINLIKACSVLMEGRNGNWRKDLPALPDPNKFPYNRLPSLYNAALTNYKNALQARIDVLTEMQTRVSFIGPLIGFAAAQQAAKANGIKVLSKLDFYIEELNNNPRYRSPHCKDIIDKYSWRAPYTALLETISNNGIAVYPNTTANSLEPSIYPPELGDSSFYATIHGKYNEIQNAKGGAVYPQSTWSSLLDFVYLDNWASRFANPPWWEIDYSNRGFPEESEIFTLGLRKNSSGNSHSGTPEMFQEIAKKHLSSENAESLYGINVPDTSGVTLNMFCYDNTWYPEYYSKVNKVSTYNEETKSTEVYDKYMTEHFNYWFKKGVLRKNVRERYTYEGPAAYVETYTQMDKLSSLIKVSGQQDYGDGSIRIGSKREGESVSISTDYRPGSIAKALGALNEKDPPIALPQVLPVFDKVIIMPTYMPIPYNFKVLRNQNSELRRFLAWLAGKRNLERDEFFPSGCDNYLEALKILIKGPEFRYYGWNPNFNEAEFDKTWHTDVKKWNDGRVKEPSKYQYNIKSGTTLPGYYQEPNIFTACETTKERTGIVEVPTYNYEGKKTGTAKRHFINKNRQYMVVTSSNHIITRAESDPTWNPNCCGTCYRSPGTGTGGGKPGMNQMNPGASIKKGPPGV